MNDLSIKPLKPYIVMVLSFFIPFFILLSIYASVGVYPFGNGSLMTIDLGQQYIDFFAYFRYSLTTDPTSILYSFSKSIGGEMIGQWAYYLTSPLNLIFLLVSHNQIDVATTVLILLKLSLCSFTFSIMLLKTFKVSNYATICFSISYGLMSYLTVNQFNVMWLDGIIWLPLIILGLNRFVESNRWGIYVSTLSIAIFSNYYIGFMICLFLALFFIYLICSKVNGSFRSNSLLLLKFIGLSLLSIGLTSFLLFPTAYSLLGGKASYNHLGWSIKFAYSPIYLISKLYIGSFNFDQLPTGYPNLFIGSLALFSGFSYFFSKKIRWQEKISSLFVIITLLVSMNLELLNKIWHGGQFPIWYPYRFSFVLCFFVLWIGYKWYIQQETIPIWLSILFICGVAASTIYFFIYQENYLMPWQLFIGFSLAMFAIMLLSFKYALHRYTLLCILFVLLEMGTNSAINIHRLSYVSHSRFTTYQKMLESWYEPILPKKNEFYRIEKSFQRSKNDAMEVSAYGINHFSSSFERELPQMAGFLGFPESNGFISYKGTLFTDAFFGLKYFILHNSSVVNEANQLQEFSIHEKWMRSDIKKYSHLIDRNQASIYENPWAFPIAFPVDSSMEQWNPYYNRPLEVQNQLAIYLSESSKNLFTEVPFSYTLENVHEKKLEGSISYEFTKIDETKDGFVKLTIPLSTNHPYYLVLDGSIPKENIQLHYQNKKYEYYPSFRHDVALNIANEQKDTSISFDIELKKHHLLMKQPKIYQLDTDLLKNLSANVQKQGLQLASFAQTSFKGKVAIEKDSTMLTTIPYSKGWHVQVDGQTVDTFKVFDSFLAFRIPKGEHQIVYRYFPPLLKEGIAVSLTSLGIIMWLVIRRNHPRKRRGFNKVASKKHD